MSPSERNIVSFRGAVCARYKFCRIFKLDVLVLQLFTAYTALDFISSEGN
jgi:hypothetical protein